MMGSVIAKAPTVPAHELRWTNRDQEILLLSQSPTSLSLVYPSLGVETELIPTSPPLFINMHGPLRVGDLVASGDVQLPLAMPPLGLQVVAPLERSNNVTPSASAHLALLNLLLRDSPG